MRYPSPYQMKLNGTWPGQKSISIANKNQTFSSEQDPYMYSTEYVEYSLLLKMFVS
jgi:hypothetical protein